MYPLPDYLTRSKVLLNRYLHDVLDLFYPRPCCGCGAALVGNEAHICTRCRISLPRTESHRLSIQALEDKFAGKVAVRAVYSFLRFEKKGKVQRILHGLKYNNLPEAGHLLGQLYGQELRETNVHEQLDLLVPVPLHESKKKQRGYNQSDVFAEGLADTLGVEWSAEVLKRSRSTSTQTRKTRIERFENVAGIFEVTQPERIKGQRIGLVDDVVTTGSTLESAVMELLQHGAREVSVITIAASY